MGWTYEADVESFTVYHLEQEEEKTSSDTDQFLPALGNALAGAAGTAVSNVLVYPLALVITRLQVQKKLGKKSGKSTANRNAVQYDGVIDATKKIFANEGGYKAFYSGVLHDTSKSVLDSFLFFLAYNVLMRWRKNRHGGTGSTARLPVFEELGIGMLAGAFARGITMPIQQIVTRKQTSALDSVSDEKTGASAGKEPTAAQIIREIYDREGLQGFWTGFSATVLLTLNPSLTFYMDAFLRRLLRHKEKPGAAMTFLVAALGKACASSITYPLTVAKARAQGAKTKPGNVLATIPATIRTDGVASLYDGLSGEVTKGFISHGLTMLVKDRIHKHIVALYFFLKNLSAQQKS